MTKRFFTILYAFIALSTMAQAQKNMINGHEYVDLGLPSGTLWATCNVGASNPEESGNYFMWGALRGAGNGTRGYRDDGMFFMNSTYVDKVKSECFDRDTGELYYSADVANVHWGSYWQIPRLDQIEELIHNCNWEWTTLNNVYGRKATSKKNGKSIFLPCAGWRDGVDLISRVYEGRYWSRTVFERTGEAYYLKIRDGYRPNRSWDHRYLGFNVRPVHRKK